MSPAGEKLFGTERTRGLIYTSVNVVLPDHLYNSFGQTIVHGVCLLLSICHFCILLSIVFTVKHVPQHMGILT